MFWVVVGGLWWLWARLRVWLRVLGESGLIGVGWSLFVSMGVLEVGVLCYSGVFTRRRRWFVKLKL